MEVTILTKQWLASSCQESPERKAVSNTVVTSPDLTQYLLKLAVTDNSAFYFPLQIYNCEEIGIELLKHILIPGSVPLFFRRNSKYER